MDYNVYKTKKRRKKNSAVTIMLITSTIFAFMLCAALLFFYAEQRNKTLQAVAEVKILKEENENMYTKNQVEEFIEKAKQEILDKIKSMLESGEGMLSILQKYYPNYVIATSRGSYYFFPISDKLEKNNFNLEKFTYPVFDKEKEEWQGTATYMKGTREEAKKGIDVSTFQGDINWKKVKDTGMDFAIIRLGFRGYENGKIVLDSKFKDNIEGSLKVGLDTGVYFFTEALTEEEAIEEAEFVIENLKEYKINMPVVIDVEESANIEKTRTRDLTANQRTKNVIAFCERIKKAGYDIMIYGNLKSFMIMMNIDELEEYDKWFAYYRYPFHFPYKIKMWQYTAYEKVDGIEGKTDVNLMFY